MNKIKALLTVFATLVSITAAGATDMLPPPDMTVEELAAAVEDAISANDEESLYSYFDIGDIMARDAVTAGDDDKAIETIGIMLNAEPMIYSYFANDPAFASIADNEVLIALLDDAKTEALNKYITIPVGEEAPDFELEDVNGAIYKLSDFRGKAVLLNIWATWCPPCQAEIPDLIEIQNEYGGDDFTIISISVDEAPVSEVRDFASGIGINYPVLMDDGNTANSYIEKAGGIPETYVIDKEGNVASFIYGGTEKGAFVSAIEPVLK